MVTVRRRFFIKSEICSIKVNICIGNNYSEVCFKVRFGINVNSCSAKGYKENSYSIRGEYLPEVGALPLPRSRVPGIVGTRARGNANFV